MWGHTAGDIFFEDAPPLLGDPQNQGWLGLGVTQG